MLTKGGDLASGTIEPPATRERAIVRVGQVG